jgi:hypothetical protein
MYFIGNRNCFLFVAEIGKEKVIIPRQIKQKTGQMVFTG